MNIILYALPFIILQLLNRQSIARKLRSLPTALVIGSLFIVLPTALYAPLFILSIVNTMHVRAFNAPLNLKSLKVIRQWSSLRDSAKEGGVSVFNLLLLLLISAFYSLYLSKSSPISLTMIPLVFICPTNLLPYPLYLLTLPFRRRRVLSEGVIPIPQNERFAKDNTAFPLEKITTSFTGKKLFSIPSSEKNPHVVFIYLESFRSSDLSKTAPHFTKLAQEGIYFSNFYANASQTFKAMFSTLYGLPACFGSDFTESSSPVLTLPLNGLPDFFKARGYTNQFIKAGSHNFDNQGEFLRNHNVDYTFDEKEIKRAFPDAYGTSWGVHDEFMFSFLEKSLEEAKDPLFVQASTVTNHHPFLHPNNFEPQHGETPFEKTMEYTDQALSDFVSRLKASKKPVHLYIMGDHGYPINHDREPRFSPSLDKCVTHVPFLILPINCGKVILQEIDTVSSQVDILPTLMDLYHFKGKNSSIGSSLLRQRKDPQALLLNESIEPISGTVTKEKYHTFKGYLPLYNTLYSLYKKKAISSAPGNLKTLNLCNTHIPHNELQHLLTENPSLENLYLSDSMLITDLEYEFPQTLKKITLDNNILITDGDIALLPSSIESISLLGCKNLTDKSLLFLSSCTELSLDCSKFSGAALLTLLKDAPLQKLSLENGPHLTEEILLSITSHCIEEIILKNISGVTDRVIRSLTSRHLKMFLCDNCSLLTDQSATHLQDSCLEVLHLEKGLNFSDTAIHSLSSLPLHTFYISGAAALTKTAIDSINTPQMRNLFCIDCKNLPQILDESQGKKVYMLKEEV
jgi:arylsulfatase A-like enzyme